MPMHSRTAHRVTWAFRILLAIVFVAAALAKLAGIQAMVQVFAAIGLGQWFRYVTGVVELTGAILLLVPASGFAGASLLAVTMACAIGTHLLVIGGNPVPAIVLCVLCAFVVYRLRPAGHLPVAVGVAS